MKIIFALDPRHSSAAYLARKANSVLPVSFNDDGQLFAFNLFLMTAFMCLGMMMSGRMARAIWHCRSIDMPRHPVTIWRVAWLLAGAAVFLRCGTEAMNLWAWNPADPVTTARVLMAKRWIDPASLTLTTGWMVLVVLSNSVMEKQLTRRPYPINMLTRLPTLRRPLLVILLSLVAAVGVASTL